MGKSENYYILVTIAALGLNVAKVVQIMTLG